VETTHLEVVAELQDGTRRTLEERVLDLLAPGAVLMHAKLRDSLAVKNERLGEVLERLDRAGELCRTPLGWQRLNRSSEGGVPVPHREKGMERCSTAEPPGHRVRTNRARRRLRQTSY